MFKKAEMPIGTYKDEEGSLTHHTFAEINNKKKDDQRRNS